MSVDEIVLYQSNRDGGEISDATLALPLTQEHNFTLQYSISMCKG